MNNKLLGEALAKYILGVVVVGILVFLPAGSLSFWQGWLLMGILFVPMLVAGIVMMAKNPDLLRKRLNAKEEENEQKSIVALSGMLFISAFVIAGLNWRFQWIYFPDWAVWTSSAIFILCYLLYAEVMRENAYLSRTIQVEEGQTVVDTGLYGIVRHPMYMSTLLLFLMIPLVLGSWYALIPFGFYPVIIIVRLKDEEDLLSRELVGYDAYKQKVKYRLLPYIW